MRAIWNERLWLAVLLCGTLAVADDKEPDANEGEPDAKEGEPAPKVEKGAGDVEIGDFGVPIADRAVASSEVARFQTAMKDAKRKKDDDKKVELLRKLSEKDHAVIYKELTKWVKNKDHRVATTAVIGIARQKSSAKKAGPFLQKLIGREKRTDPICAAIVGMGVLNYKRAFKDVRKYFRKTLAEPHKAAARYFGYTKAKQTFRMLAEELEAPRPSNPNDPNNPPASYWEERWKKWKANEPAIRWALAQFVEGETFETTAEAKQWAETEGKKHGIEW